MIKLARSDNNRTAASDNGELYFFNENPQPELAWKYTSNLNFHNIAISMNGNLICGGAAPKIPQGKKSKTSIPRHISLFDNKGNILFEKKYDNHGFKNSNEAPLPSFSPDNKKLIVVLKNSIEFYYIEDITKKESIN